MRGGRRLLQILLTAVLSLLIFAAGTKMVKAEETDMNSTNESGAEQMSEEERREVEEKASELFLDQFDFSQIEDSLQEMMPAAKVSFRDVVVSMMSGDTKNVAETFYEFIRDQVTYEFRSSRKNLVYMLLVALCAAVFSNFAGAFRSRQASELSFYILYMLLITLCLTAFRVVSGGMEDDLDALTGFMRVLCPSYFLAVSFATGSATSMFFYQVVLFLIFAVETVVAGLLLPVVNMYIMIRILGSLTGEDFLSEFAELLKKLVTWSLRTLLACVIGVNVVQGILSPAVDTLKRSALTQTAKALPWIGNVMGGAAEIVFGTAVLIRNGIGMAGAVSALVICAVPLIQTAVLAFMYRLAAALVQPVSDKRITACISGVSEGYELLMRILFTSCILFLLTIAVVAASSS